MERTHKWTAEERAHMAAEANNPVHDPSGREARRTIDALSLTFGTQDVWAARKRETPVRKAAA